MLKRFTLDKLFKVCYNNLFTINCSFINLFLSFEVKKMIDNQNIKNWRKNAPIQWYCPRCQALVGSQICSCGWTFVVYTIDYQNGSTVYTDGSSQVVFFRAGSMFRAKNFLSFKPDETWVFNLDEKLNILPLQLAVTQIYLAKNVNYDFSFVSFDAII